MNILLSFYSMKCDKEPRGCYVNCLNVSIEMSRNSNIQSEGSATIISIPKHIAFHYLQL